MDTESQERTSWRVFLLIIGLIVAVMFGLLFAALNLNAVQQPATLTLSAGQSEGNIVSVGIRSGELWFTKARAGFFSWSYSAAFPLPERVGPRVSIMNGLGGPMSGPVYAVTSVDPGADTIRLKLVGEWSSS